MQHLSIDIETFSSEPIAKTGLYKYVQSPDFEILLLAWSLDGSPVQVIDLARGEKIPDELKEALFDETVIKHAFNAAFEWYCLSKWLQVDDPVAWLPQWRCTMLHSQYCGYPSSLKAAGAALGLKADKQKDRNGDALIRYFCIPCAPSAKGRVRNMPYHAPDRWLLFKEYNRQDVVAEMEIERRLSRFPVPKTVQKQWEQNQIINRRGAALDLPLIEGALAMDQQKSALLQREAVELTGLSNPNSRSQLLQWLAGQGVTTADLQSETIADLLKKDDLSPTVRRVLEIRQDTGKTSIKKYAAMKEAVCADGRVRGLLKFYGANRSGRWAGQLIQPQNLPRTYLDAATVPLARELTKSKNIEALQMIFGSVPDTLSQLIRTAFVPSKGNRFVDADFSAIEARVIAWLSDEQWRLSVFRSHGKIYEASAAAMFGVPIETIAKGKENYSLRAKGKIAELALGYQGGVGALTAMGALKMGLTEEELQGIVQRWRKANPCIVRLWNEVQNAALEAVRTGQPRVVAGKCGFVLTSDGEDQTFLTVILPSGREMYYAHPFLSQNRFGAESLSFWGLDQQTKKWSPQETYGGKLTENIVQAVARDCLAFAIEQLEKAGFPIVFHIHDEVVIDVPPDRADLDTVVHIMSQPPPWAKDLPLAADGWVGDYFTKD